jgi:acyl-CoA hydrolase
MKLEPKRAADSATEMVQVVLPNDANPLGFILGGTVMHLIDIAAAIACHRHTRSLLVTAAVDEAQVDVHSEETLTGTRRLTSRAYLTFVAIARDGTRVPVPPLLLETDQERRICEEAQARRAARLERKVTILA